MTGPDTSEYRFYTDLASWWPLISPPADYAEEAAFVTGLLRDAPSVVRSVLELGSGGGHNAFHLKAHFTMTLADRSEQMLAVSEALNPECDHVQGDMRSLRLGRYFDAVFIHDAIDYMTTERDLRAALETAYAHCRPGGTVVLAPDATAETFTGATDHGGTDGPDGRGVRYLEWGWDPDPADTSVRTEYVFVLRAPDGIVDVVHEAHETGLFPSATWLDLMEQVGLNPRAVREVTTEERRARTLFVGTLRP